MVIATWNRSRPAAIGPGWLFDAGSGSESRLLRVTGLLLKKRRGREPLEGGAQARGRQPVDLGVSEAGAPSGGQYAPREHTT
jgi:hypothetical protein